MYRHQFRYGFNDGVYRPDAVDRSLGRSAFGYEDLLNRTRRTMGGGGLEGDSYSPPSISRGTQLTPRGTDMPYGTGDYTPRISSSIRKDEPIQGGNQGYMALSKVELDKRRRPPSASVLSGAIPDNRQRPATMRQVFSQGGGSTLYNRREGRWDPSRVGVSSSAQTVTPDQLQSDQAILQSGQQLSTSALPSSADPNSVVMPSITNWSNDPSTRNLQQYLYLRGLEEDYNRQAAKQNQEEALWAYVLGQLPNVLSGIFGR